MCVTLLIWLLPPSNLCQLELNPVLPTEPPVWFMQALIVTISFGIRSGDSGSFQRALSWASLLANVSPRLAPVGFLLLTVVLAT